MHMPTLRQLQFLCALADEGSFSRAAKVTLVAQPTLSAAIKDVEALLGVRLFERIARGARLTPAGKIAVERARKILADTQDLVTTAQAASAPLSGTFRLGAIPTIAPFILPRTLKKLHADYPALALYLREEKTADLLAALKSQTIDAALIALPWPMPGTETMEIAPDEFLLACPAGHRLESARSITPSSLDGETLLLLEEGHCLRGHALNACSKPDADASMGFAATSLQTMVHMVGGGLGISLIPKLAVEAGIVEGTGTVVREFTTAIPHRTIGIAWRKGSANSADAQLIGSVIKGLLTAGGA
ncbi:MAG: hydrogen peroxide-inducible genes activator [Hyphomonadaceae bacterium]